MRTITDEQSLFQWAREKCQTLSIKIGVGKDEVTGEYVVIINEEWALLPINIYLDDARFVIDEMIKKSTNQGAWK